MPDQTAVSCGFTKLTGGWGVNYTMEYKSTVCLEHLPHIVGLVQDCGISSASAMANGQPIMMALSH